MKWQSGTPPNKEFCNDLYFVRMEEDRLGGKTIIFDTHVWYGDRWYPIPQYRKITHWAYIEDAIPLQENCVYSDKLGRLNCVTQSKIFPNLSTPLADTHN